VLILVAASVAEEEAGSSAEMEVATRVEVCSWEDQ